MFNWLNKKKVEQKPLVILNAFRFKYMVMHKVDGFVQPHETIWTSDIYFDYRKACNTAYDVIKSINDSINKAKDDEYVFHLDFSVKKKDIVTVNAYDVYHITLHDGVIVSNKDIAVEAGKNIVYDAPKDVVFYYEKK